MARFHDLLKSGWRNYFAPGSVYMRRLYRPDPNKPHIIVYHVYDKWLPLWMDQPCVESTECFAIVTQALFMDSQPEYAGKPEITVIFVIFPSLILQF